MQVGSSVGTAILNSVAVAATAAYAGTDAREALVHGYATATGWSAVALAVTAVLVLVLVRTPRPEQAD
jgi:hypothetical protein